MQFTTAAEAAKLIRSHSSVYIQGSTSIPEVLVQAMTDRADELTDVKIYSGFAVGRADAPYCRPEYKDTFLVNSLFVANNIRRWLAAGYGQSIPAFLGEIPGLFRDGTLPVDVAILNLSRPNEEGYCSFGVSADLAVSAVECAKTVIAQVNTAMPFSYGDAVIHLSRVAAAVEVDDPLVEVPSATPSEIESRIGGYIAELIPDGATLQIGVGGIPNAVLAALTGHKHLGLHTEAMTDGVLPLLESGVIDNSLKKVMPGTTVASLALGEDGVEGQRRFSRTRKARYDDQFVVRNLDLDVLEVVDPRAFDIDGFFVCHFVSLKPRNAADRISGFRFLTFDSQMSSPAMLPPAFFSFSVSSPARLSRMVSTIVQRLSNSCDAILGCCSLMTRMMSFMAM